MRRHRTGPLAAVAQAPRACSADAIAHAATDRYLLPRERFHAYTQEHHRRSFQLLDGLGSALPSRLRYADAELRALEEY